MKKYTSHPQKYIQRRGARFWINSRFRLFSGVNMRWKEEFREY